MMKTMIARTACILSSMAFCLTSLDLSAKEYYKWVDAKGSTHYTTTPPPKNAQRKGKVNTYGATTTTQSAPAKSQQEVSREAEQPNEQNEQQAEQQREANAALRQAQAVASAPQ